MSKPIPDTPQEPCGFTTRIPDRDSDAACATPKYPFLLPAVQPDEIGRLGNYRVQRLLGKGGMGLVFQAEDIALRRAVALKVMKPELDADGSAWNRFLREARAMASIKHESLVTVYQIGQEQDHVYLAMELLEGLCLEDWLSVVGRPALPIILHIAREIAGGLVAIHRGGLIHRDLKLTNLWREEPTGRVKILDFGLARFVNDDVGLTQTGMVLGTPAYMSPEQARGEPLDPRSDLFSFGCVLYALCTGTSPFRGKNTTAVLTALAVHEPSPVNQVNPAIPSALAELVTQLLSKDPAGRPSSSEAVLERLLRMDSETTETSPTQRIVSAEDSRDKAAVSATHPIAPTPFSRPWVKALSMLAPAILVGVLVPWASSSLPRSTAKGESSSKVASSPDESNADEKPRAPGGPAGIKSKLAETAGVVAKTLPPGKAGPMWAFLSDLNPIGKENWPFTPPHPPPPMKGHGFPPGKPEGPPPPPPGKSSNAVRVQGRESPHGIFMHPPPAWEGTASLTYQLTGGFSTFRASVSLNDGPPRSETPFTFAIYGDNHRLWQSRPLSTQADTQNCAISVQGVMRLRLEVRSAGDPRAAHAVWFEPHLSR
jgi:serine/threonine protein kinase